MSLRKFARLVAVPALLLPFATCSDFTGPAGRGAQIPVIPTFSPAATFARALYAAAGIEYDRVRVVIARGETVLKDTTIAFSPASPELSLPLTIAAAPGEAVKATLQYLTATMVLYEGTSTVTTIALGAPAPAATPIVLVPVGPGSSAETVRITPAGGSFSVSAPVSFTADALGSDGAEIPNPVIGWTVDDPTVATVDAHGVVQPTSKGGSAKVRASTLNGKFAEAAVTFVTAPASLVVQSGGDQTAMAFEPLPSHVVVKVRDGNGNGVPSAAVTFAVAGGGGTIEAVSSTTDASGLIAVKWALGGDVGGQSITALASALPNAPLTINATATERPAKTLGFGQQPTKSIMGAAISPAVTVKALDDHGRVVTGFTGPITVTFETNPKAATLGGTLTTNAAAGIATFADLTVSAAGQGYKLKAGNVGLTTTVSDAFDVEQVPSGLSLFAGGSQTAAIRTKLSQVKVKVADANGIAVPGVTVNFEVVSGGGTIAVDNAITDADGLARATWTLGDAIGTQTIRATSTGLTSLEITATATALPATGLAFVQGPSNVKIDSTISPAVTVKAIDADGNTVTSFTGDIELVLQNNPNNATLGGTRIVAAVNGVATFSTLSVNMAGSGFALKATSGTLAAATSGTFVVSPPAATALAFQVQPSNTQTGNVITPAITVRVVDANGNTVPGATNSVALAKSNPLIDYGISGTLTVNAVNGVATFSNVTVVGPGSGYALKATSSGLTEATSSGFTVSAAPPPSKTWVGTNSSDWNTDANWSPLGIPTSSDSVNVVGATNAPSVSTSPAARVIVIKSGGKLTVTGAATFEQDVVVQGTLEAQSGATVNGTLSIASSGTLRLVAREENLTFSTGGFVNSGTIELTSTTFTLANLEVTSDKLVNESGGTIKALGGEGGGERRITGILDNKGAIIVDATGFFTLRTSSTSNSNSGTITLDDGSPGGAEPPPSNTNSFVLAQVDGEGGGWLTNTGTVSIGVNRTFSIGTATLLKNAAGGVIGGTGTLQRDPEAGGFENIGTIAPGGQGKAGSMTFDGNLDLSSGSGTLEIEVAGIAPGEYDVLNIINGGLTLGGTLKVKFIGNPSIASAALNVIHPPSFPSGSFEIFDAPEGWSKSFVENDVRIGKIIGF